MGGIDLTAVVKAALAAGVIAGLALGLSHYIITEPIIDEAIRLEEQASGPEAVAEEVLPFLRSQQKLGLLLGSTILGITSALVFGLVYSLSYHKLPGSGPVRKGIFLALMAYMTVFLIPFFKYPANPPGVGLTETINYRVALYTSFIALSIIGVVAFLLLWKALSSRIRNPSAKGIGGTIALLSYLAYIALAYTFMPPNPDPLTAPIQLILNFRILSILAQAVFWSVLGATFGSSWVRFHAEG